MFSLNLKLRTPFGNPCNVILCDVKYDGDCISGLTFVWGNLIWSCIRWFIGTLPERPRDYTVWSTLEPLGMDSRTWAGIIQVGSTTIDMLLRSCSAWSEQRCIYLFIFVFLVLKRFWWRVILVILNDYDAALVLNSKSIFFLLFVIV
jgi:hypothetical protein